MRTLFGHPIVDAETPIVPPDASLTFGNLREYCRNKVAQERADLYREKLLAGEITVNQIREAEGLPAIEGGDVYWIPVLDGA